MVYIKTLKNRIKYINDIKKSGLFVVRHYGEKLKSPEINIPFQNG